MIQELSDASVIAAALVHGESKNDLRMYYPRKWRGTDKVNKLAEILTSEPPKDWK